MPNGRCKFTAARVQGRGRRRAKSVAGEQTGNMATFLGKPRRNGRAYARQSLRSAICASWNGSANSLLPLQGAEPGGACRARIADVLIRAAAAPVGSNNHSPLRPNHTPTSALSATNARKPLTITNSAGGKLLASGRGGRDTGLRSRHTPATKQKAANITRKRPICARRLATIGQRRMWPPSLLSRPPP